MVTVPALPISAELARPLSTYHRLQSTSSLLGTNGKCEPILLMSFHSACVSPQMLTDN